MVNNVSPGHWRIQALTISLVSSTILLVNSYYPVDPKANNFDENEVIETLQVIKRIVEENVFHSVLFLGDINCDFRRNTLLFHMIRTFLQEHNLHQGWDKFEVDFTHFQENNEVTYVSIIDPFFWSGAFDQNVNEAGVIHHPENTSDHSPIYCSINLETIPVEATTPNLSTSSEKPSWKRATKEQKENFPAVLQEYLSKISVPDEVRNCRDVNCKDLNHWDKADKFINNLLECVENSAAEALPTPKSPRQSPTKSKPVPGWSYPVKPFKDKAYFWHQVWNSAGKPLNSELHRIMKKY